MSSFRANAGINQPGSSTASSGAVRALAMELKGLQQSPVEGFTVTAND